MFKNFMLSLSVLSLLGVTATTLPNKDIAEGFKSDMVVAATTPVKYEAGIEDHIIYQDKSVARADGVGGAHNLNEFKKVLAIKGTSEELKVSRIDDHPSRKGTFYKYVYQIRALDGTAKPTVAPAELWKAQIFQKTVYDPAKVSNENYIKMGKEAAENANSKGTLTREWTGTSKDGILFRGYLNTAGEVKTFYPDI